MLLFSLLIFFSVTLTLAALALWLLPGRTQERLRAITPQTERSGWVETAAQVVGPFAKLSTPTGDWEGSPLRLRFLHAGIRHRDAPLIYFGAKTLLPLLFAFAAWLINRSMLQAQGSMLAFVLMASALIGCYLPNLVLGMLVRRRQREIFESFPDAADLMLVCVEAGLGLDAGLTRVAEELRRKSVALAEELHLTNLEMRAGGTREKSLHNLALRTGVEELGTFATMLNQADRLGTSIGDSLRVFSDDLRHKRQTRAEEAAAKVPTKMLFPLVICIFPSIIMVILGPAGIQIMRTILPLLNGTH